MSNIHLLLSTQLLFRLGVIATPLLSLLFQSRFGSTAEEIGTFLMLFGVGSLFSGLIVGYAISVIGPKSTTVTSLSITLLCTLFIIQDLNVLEISIICFLYGLTNENLKIAVYDTINRSPNSSSGNNIFYFKASFWISNVGLGIALSLQGLLIEKNIELLVLLLSITLIFCIILISSVKLNSKTSEKQSKLSISSFTSKPFIVVFAVCLVNQIIFLQILYAIPFIASQSGISGKVIGFILVIRSVFILLLQPIFTYLTKDIRSELLLFASLVLLFISCLINIASFGVISFTLALILVACAEVNSSGAAVDCLSKSVLKKDFLVMAGTLRMAFGLSLLLAPGSFVIIDLFGPKIFWMISASLGGCATIFLYKPLKGLKKHYE